MRIEQLLADEMADPQRLADRLVAEAVAEPLGDPDQTADNATAVVIHLVRS